MGGRDHILSPSYLWAVYLTAVLLTRALCTSCIQTYISNKKMVKSCAAIGFKKDTVVEKAFIDFLVVNLDKKQWLASMKLLNPPVLKYAYVCSDHSLTRIMSGITHCSQDYFRVQLTRF